MTARPADSRRFTKRTTVQTGYFCAAVIAACLTPWVPAAAAAIAIPSAFALLAALHGIYQGVGHMDLRTMAAVKSEGEP